ncbi:MAG: glycosyltransferase family 4 protein [Eubacteriales bacterium]|nr:glycosyltransferase family 4 protein [Eubacteriales bacterium]
MKIAVVYQHYYPEQFRLTPICEELVKQGHQVVVYTGLPNYPHGNIPKKYRFFQNRREEHNGVQIVRSFEIGRKPGKIGLAINYVSFTISSIWRALWAPLDFDVIFSYSTSPVLMTLPGIILKKRSGKTLHMYLMDIWPACLSAMHVQESALLYKIMRKVSKYIYKQCDSIQYSSKAFQSYMLQEHNIQLKQEDYLPQFAESLFENEAQSIDSTISNFVFAGNVGHMQSVETIVEAAQILKNEDIHVQILGEGSALAKCKAYAEDLGLTNIEFLGRKPVEQMPEYYAKADAMLVTMRNDSLVNKTLPGKVQSYMAFAKPIIGAINGETMDVLQEANAGFVSPAEDAVLLADNMLRFHQLSKEEKLVFAQNAKSYYNTHFKFQPHFQALLNALQKGVQ